MIDSVAEESAHASAEYEGKGVVGVGEVSEDVFEQLGSLENSVNW